MRMSRARASRAANHVVQEQQGRSSRSAATRTPTTRLTARPIRYNNSLLFTSPSHRLTQDDPVPTYREVTLNDGGLERLDDIVDLGVVVPDRGFWVDVRCLRDRQLGSDARERRRTSSPVTSQYFFIGMMEGGASTETSARVTRESGDVLARLVQPVLCAPLVGASTPSPRPSQCAHARS